MARTARRSSEVKNFACSKRLSSLRKSAIPPSRDGSYASDESSTPNRFLKSRKKSEEIAPSTESSSTDRVYKLQQGKKVEKIMGVNKDEPNLRYAVLYEGTAPQHQRMEYVPSNILREYALEEFVDFLEQLVVQSVSTTEPSP
ncbi:unnamed protein product [Strongylus vulgaris]|uniref:Chromo shadow domain-containing protein n=1 Tax=Strongylus vulgaris TaxID=40348 RepID=A0A3P7I6P7_STRVU|nr:unnamed protein product [Strongylus vulgaris]